MEQGRSSMNELTIPNVAPEEKLYTEAEVLEAIEKALEERGKS